MLVESLQTCFELTILMLRQLRGLSLEPKYVKEKNPISKALVYLGLQRLLTHGLLWG